MGVFFDGADSSLKIGDLPFLFKVLSINQALSIQAHPNKEHARILHARDPKNYPDPNHKPEMLISISDGFEALCGFRPSHEIAEHLERYVDLADLCGQANASRFVQLARENTANNSELEFALRACFESLMNASDDRCKSRLDELKIKISKGF